VTLCYPNDTSSFGCLHGVVMLLGSCRQAEPIVLEDWYVNPALFVAVVVVAFVAFVALRYSLKGSAQVEGDAEVDLSPRELGFAVEIFVQKLERFHQGNAHRGVVFFLDSFCIVIGTHFCQDVGKHLVVEAQHVDAGIEHVGEFFGLFQEGFTSDALLRLGSGSTSASLHHLVFESEYMKRFGVQGKEFGEDKNAECFVVVLDSTYPSPAIHYFGNGRKA